MKRVVFTDLELKLLSESPEALKVLAAAHSEMGEKAKADELTEIAELHFRRASTIDTEVNGLMKCRSENEPIPYEEFQGQPMTMDLPVIAEFIERLSETYSANIGFDRGYSMACARILDFVQNSQYKKFKTVNRLVYHSRVADLMHLMTMNAANWPSEDREEIESCMKYLKQHIPQTLDDVSGSEQVELKAPDGTVMMELKAANTGEFVEPLLPLSMRLTDSTGRTVEMFPVGSQVPAGWRLVPNVISEEWTARYIDSLNEDQQPVGTFKSTVKVLSRMLKTAPIYK
jgi:uncharacterized protein YbdZ (MbtH family)